MDISWDEVAKYIVATPESVAAAASIISRHPDRFLFGSDVVAPSKVDAMVAVYDMYAPLWKALPPDVSLKVRKGNYERIFDAARLKVRAWEKQNIQ